MHLAQHLQDFEALFCPLPDPAAFTMPVLLLSSGGATFSDPSRSTQLVARFPSVSVRRIDCHHWPLTERPREVRQAIEEWWAGAVECPVRPG